MTDAQEIYDKLMTFECSCKLCEKRFKFSEVINWGEKEGGGCNVTCPYCETPQRIDGDEIEDVFYKIGEIDRKIATLIIDYADRGGKFSEDSIHQTIYYKCAMVMKHAHGFRSYITMRPLDYIERTAMLQIYNELVAMKAIDPIDIYEAQAPTPVEFDKKNIEPLSLGSGPGKEYKKKRWGGKKKKQTSGSKLKFTFGSSSSKNSLDSDKILEDFLK